MVRVALIGNVKKDGHKQNLWYLVEVTQQRQNGAFTR